MRALAILLSVWLIAQPQVMAQRCSGPECSTWCPPSRIQSQVPPRRPLVPVVRPAIRWAISGIRIYDRNNAISLQQGGLVWKHDTADVAFVATAAHGFTSDSTRVVVQFDSQGYEAEIKHVDHIWDVAILAIRKPALDVIPLATTDPTEGTVLYVRGRDLRWQTGPFLGWASPGRQPLRRILRFALRAISGQSGSPILLANGQLVGLVSAGDESETFGPAADRIRIAIDIVLKASQAADKPPKPVEPPPKPDEQPPKPVEDDHAALMALIRANARAIAALAARETVPGPPGERGPQGEPGPPGERGPQGPGFTLAAVTDEQIDEFALRLPMVKLQTVTTEGKVIHEASAPLGKPVKLRLVPVRSGDR